MRCYVYIYKDSAGVVRYVGKGTGSRIKDHVSLARSLNAGRRLERASHFTRWLAKCLRTGAGFTWEVVCGGLSDAEAFAMEQQLIAKHKRAREGGTLYNTLDGGEGFTTADAQRTQKLPGVQAKKSAALKAAFAKPDVLERLRQATTESNGRPHRRIQAREKAIAEWARPQRRATAAQRARELWADPAWAAERRAELVARNKRGSKPSVEELERAAQ